MCKYSTAVRQLLTNIIYRACVIFLFSSLLNVFQICGDCCPWNCLMEYNVSRPDCLRQKNAQFSIL